MTIPTSQNHTAGRPGETSPTIAGAVLRAARMSAELTQADLAVAAGEATACLLADPVASQDAFRELLAWALTGNAPSRHARYGLSRPIIGDATLSGAIARLLEAVHPACGGWPREATLPGVGQRTRFPSRSPARTEPQHAGHAFPRHPPESAQAHGVWRSEQSSNATWPCRSTGGDWFHPASHRKASIIASIRPAMTTRPNSRACTTPVIARRASSDT